MANLFQRAADTVARVFGFGDEDVTYPAVQIDREHSPTAFYTMVSSIPDSANPELQEALDFLHRIRQDSPLDANARKDRTVQWYGELRDKLMTIWERDQLRGRIPEGQWLGLTGTRLHDQLHLARIELRRYIRRRFAPEGWRVNQPTPISMLRIPPKLLYLSDIVYICQMMVRVTINQPYVSQPEPSEYD